MAKEIIVAVFDSSEHAQKAAEALERAGVPAADIERHNQSRPGAAPEHRDSKPQATGFFFWDLMVGMASAHQDRSDYERRVERGQTVLAVTIHEDDADAVMSILERHAPLDLEEHPAEAASAHTRAPEQASRTDRETRAARPESRETVDREEEEEEVIPLAEESLQVGKRTVNRGTTRIRRYTVETPVEKTVSLRDERVILERRTPVTDAVTGDALTEKTVEVTETSEVPVAHKVARLKEEVVVRREGVEHKETLQDTVRRDQIAVEDATDTPRRARAR
jgi:uncharacterized protein (TIGR02271 family)